VQTDPQRRQPLRPRHRVGGRGRTDHQAGGGQDAVAMGDFDGFVDFRRQAEIVCRDDEIFQLAIPYRT